MNPKKPIDWTKPVQTSEDPPRPIRVLCTDAKGEYPVIGLVDGCISEWTPNGKYYIEEKASTKDAQNVPEPEQPKDPYAHLKQALAEGKVIQLDYGDDEWKDFYDPKFGCPPEYYRIKPTMKRAPLERDDVPLGSTIQLKDEEWLVIGVTKTQVSLGGDGYSFSDLMKFEAKIQRPGSSTFEPCYKEVEE